MSHTLTIRLPRPLAAWLEDTAERLGVSQGRLIRDALEKARSEQKGQPFMRLAGIIRGSRSLSKRKGFARS